MTNKIEPIEIKEFISDLLNQIEEGVNIEERDIREPIEINVSVDKVSRAEGGIKYIVKGEVGKQTQSIATVKFKVSPKQSERSKEWSRQVQIENEANSERWSL